ncbi:MAG: PepSY domain-containing protein [Oscillospiraceae bacterium]|jgi:hypothetical protein|nr:PepSY domain-containing protein [Oscillospiraceae bacterium]
MKVKQIILTATVFALVFLRCACNGDSPASTPAVNRPTQTPSNVSTQTPIDEPTQGQDNNGSLPVEADSAQLLSVEQAMEILYENYVDAELFHPGELDKWEGETLFYCFYYDDGDNVIRYAYVNAMTGEVEIVDGIEDYTGVGGNTGEPSYDIQSDDDYVMVYSMEGYNIQFTMFSLDEVAHFVNVWS